MKKYILTLIVIILCIASYNCSGGNMDNVHSEILLLQKISPDTWDKLANKKIFFGHKSVGLNILEGIKDIMKEVPSLKLNIIDTIKDDDLEHGFLYHQKIGDNGKPLQKIKNFENIIINNSSNKFDIVMLKLCYIDFRPDTDQKEIFNFYQKTIGKIKNTNKTIDIIHFTAPLTIIDSGLKTWIKRIFGKLPKGLAENAIREEYNQSIINAYNGHDTVLDIAEIESTHVDGSRETFKYNGKTYHKLIKNYTIDGGHLNKIGRKKVAAQLLISLAKKI